MRKGSWLVMVVALLFLGGFASAAGMGWIPSPWTSRYEALAGQLRDRGPVAVLGGVPFGLQVEGVPFVPVERHPSLVAALTSNNPASVSAELRRLRLDGLLVRPDREGHGDSPRARFGHYGAVPGMTAVYLDEHAALYEPNEQTRIANDDALRMMSVARLILTGSTAPPERLFPESLRRPRPVELALVLRDGAEPIIWRSTRAGSLARALLDVSFSILDRWATRQQERYGRLRDALRTRTLTLMVFYDKGVIGTRTGDFLQRFAPPGVWSVGYERLTNWEYVLPAARGQRGDPPLRAIDQLTRERGIPTPGWLRPELSVYRFRAMQLVELSPGGTVEIYDPS